MLDKILNILQEEQIENYLINQQKEQSEEVFFIKKNLELKRRKDITKYLVTVYYDFPPEPKEQGGDIKLRGSSSCTISTAMNDVQLRETIKNTYLAATYTKNPYFPILSASETRQITESETTGPSMEQCIEALFRYDTEEDTFINSAELFITTTHYRILNSNKVDVSYSQISYSGEFVIQSIKEADIELYQDFSFTNKDSDILDNIGNLVKDMIVHGRNRSIALPVSDTIKPDTIILEGSCVKDFFEYFLQRCDAAMIYPKYSDYTKGMQLNMPFAKVTITLVPDTPYTSEGILLKEQDLLKDNEIKAITGDLRFSYYLGIPAIGNYKDFKVSGNTQSFESLRNVLRIVQFSDFQMDTLTGQFGGEYRLAYYIDSNGNCTPVTNGSISGNIIEILNTLLLSTDIQNYNGYNGPKAICYSCNE